MNIKSLLLGSAAALVAVSGARAADAVVVAEPEPVEYVRVCDVYGTSFYYIPGTEICLKVGGYVQYDIGAGDLFGCTSSNTGDDTWYKRGRFQLRMDARTETELGTLRGYFAYNFNWTTGRSGALVFVDGDDDGIVDLAISVWHDIRRPQQRRHQRCLCRARRLPHRRHQLVLHDHHRLRRQRRQ